MYPCTRGRHVLRYSPTFLCRLYRWHQAFDRHRCYLLCAANHQMYLGHLSTASSITPLLVIMYPVYVISNHSFALPTASKRGLTSWDYNSDTSAGVGLKGTRNSTRSTDPAHAIPCVLGMRSSLAVSSFSAACG